MKKIIYLVFIIHSLAFATEAQDRISYNYTSDSLINLGEFDNAIKYLESYIQLDLNNNEQLNSLATLCNLYKRKGDFSTSEYYGQLALKQKDFNNIDTSEAYGDILYNIAVAKYRFGELDSSFHYAEFALKQRENYLSNEHPKIIQNINAIGVFLQTVGDFDQCIIYQKKALDLALNSQTKNYNTIVKSHFALGASYQAINNIHRSQEQYHNALEYFKNGKADDRIYKAHIFNAIGVNLANQKDIESSQEYYTEALKLFMELKPDDIPSTSTIYSNLGNNYTNLGQLEKAKLMHKKAIDLMEKAQLKNELPWKYFNLGATFIENNEYSKALETLFKSKELNESLYRKSNELSTILLNHIALAYIKQQKIEQSREYLYKSIKIAKSLYGEKDYDLAESQYLLGLGYFQNKQYHESIQTLNKASQALILSNDTTIEFTNEIISRTLLLDIYILKEKNLWELYQKTNNTDYLKEVYELSITTNELSTITLNYYFHETAKLSLFHKIDENLFFGIRAAKKLYEFNKDRKYCEQALQFFETEKSMLLKRELNNSYAKQHTNIPDSLLAKEDHLKREISNYQNLIFVENNSESEFTIELNSKIFDKKRALEALLQELEINFPKYYALKYRQIEIDLNTLQAQLDTNAINIEYYEYGEEVFSLSISNHDILFTQDSIVNLSDKVFNLNQAISNSDINTYSQLSHKFYEKLLKPHLSSKPINRIIIIPSKSLSYLSFESFLLDKPIELDYGKLNYAIRSYAISYKNSLQPPQLNTKSPSKLYLGISPIFINENFSKLNGAQQEIAFVSDKLNGHILENTNKSKKTLLENINDYKILHFATHAESDTANSNYSKIILSANDENSSTNNLHAYEIQNTNLNTELVILSACNTGIGEYKSGEGVASLARSFNYAGAKSILVSLWSLPDYSTTRIINSFIDELYNNDKSIALQQAKVNYLKNADSHLSKPLYWAGLIIIGEEDLITLENINYSKLYILFFGVLFLLLLWYKF